MLFCCCCIVDNYIEKLRFIFSYLDTSPSPFAVYGNVSPMYTQNSCVSPHYQMMDPLSQAPTASGLQYNLPYSNYQQQQTINNQPLPPFSNVMNQSWNITSTTTGVVINQRNETNINSGALGNLLDLDSQQLRQITINSDDLQMFDANNLSANLSSSLLLNDDGPNNCNEQNMSDSLTTFANKALENM